MSLLMEALKKAEQAKRKVTEAPAAVAPAPALTLELTPADAAAPKPASIPAAQPASAAAPALTAAAFTLMTGRVADNNPSVASLEMQAASAAMQIEAAPAPKSAPTAPQITPATLKLEPGLDHSASTRTASAARRLPPRRGLPAAWTAAAVALLCALAGGGYWYYNSMAQYLTQQATLGAPQTALTSITEPPPAVAAPLPAVTPAADKIPPRAPVKIKPASKPPRVEITPLALASAPLNPPAANVPAPVIAAPGPAAPPASSNPAVNPPVTAPEPLGISRDTQQNDIFTALQTAYRAYQSGDDARAQNLYSQVLSRDEHNRDALLGMAALAVRQKDFVRAQEIYSELLTLDPRDSIAQAGFVSVSGSFDPLQQEARIKALLEQEPGASHLLFTYATFLMQQQRWLEASRTLLPAVQAQRDNADYAFNLAVCFDHLGQTDTAVKYYRAALDLAAKQSTRFRPADVQQRLQAMGASGRGGTSP